MLLHKEAFAQRNLYLLTPLNTNTFKHRNCCTQKPLHWATFTYKRFCTRKLYTDTFTQRGFCADIFFSYRCLCTQKLFSTDRSFYACTENHCVHSISKTLGVFTQEILLHRDLFTHSYFCTQMPLQRETRYTYTDQLLHTDAFTQRGFCIEKLLQTDVFTHRISLHRWADKPVLQRSCNKNVQL